MKAQKQKLHHVLANTVIFAIYLNWQTDITTLKNNIFATSKLHQRGFKKAKTRKKI